MNNNEKRGKIEKSIGKIMGDKSEQVKRKIEQVKGMVQEEERLRRKPKNK